MIEIELPCCGTTTHLDELAESVGCEACGVVLELDVPTTPEPVLAAA